MSLEQSLAEYLREELVYLIYWNHGFWVGVLVTSLGFGCLTLGFHLTKTLYQKIKNKRGV